MEREGRSAVVKDVMRMMFQLTGQLRAHMDRSAAALDLTPMQARALFVTHVPVPMRRLADALHCDASNITGIVDRLEERGLMRRVMDPDDRRRRNLLITAEGKVVNERLKDLLRDGNPVLSLDDDEIEVLHGLLLKILASGTPADVVDRQAVERS